MEPICWVGIVGIAAVVVVVGKFFKGSCHHSSCGCGSKNDAVPSKEGNASSSVIDKSKEKEINDLAK